MDYFFVKIIHFPKIFGENTNFGNQKWQLLRGGVFAIVGESFYFVKKRAFYT